MQPDLPTPEQMLEELADRVATHIDRLAPVAFDVAFDELIRQHSFLLSVNAARTPDGTPFNFAEVPGVAWSAPHKEWMHQYSRLFERAAGRIPDDRSFFAKLTRAPIRLLPEQEEPPFSRAVLEEIIDLGPLLVHRLEGWVSRRTVVETKSDESAVQRQALAGADSRAYKEVVVDIVGAWEHLLQFGIGLRAERRKAGQTDAERWDLYREEWPLLWRHLCDTAHMLAAAVWNEDEIGARHYRDMLVRWLKTLGRDDYDLYLLNRRLVFPSIFEKTWDEAVASLKPLLPRAQDSLSPSYLAGSILRCAHDDVVLLTGALLLDWTMNEKQLSDIGARTGSALLRRELVDPDEHDDRPALHSFRSIFMDVLRLDLAGERFEKGNYGEGLDSLVFHMDNMTERRVVSGRIYTPSTHHERDDVSFAQLAILMAALPEEGDDGLVERVGELAANEAALPSGDRSLRGLVWVLERFAKSLETPWPQLQRGLAGLKPDADFAALSARLSSIVDEARAVIETHRTERITGRPVDPAKLEQLRAAIEEAVLEEPAQVPIFRDFKTVKGGQTCAADEFSVIWGNVSKASLLEPPMENESSNFGETLAKAVANSAGERAWNSFVKRPREDINITARVEDSAFWLEIAKLTPRISEQPALVVSRAAEGRTVRRLLYPREGVTSMLRVEQKQREGRRGDYIATVEGVDVFGGNFTQGVCWLFSGRALRTVRYASLDAAGHHVTLAYEPENDVKGALRAKFEQSTEWSDDPIFEIRSADPADEDTE